MFWPLQSSSEFLGVLEDSKFPLLGVWVSSSHLAQSGVATGTFSGGLSPCKKGIRSSFCGKTKCFVFHTNLVELTLEGRLIANWVVRPFIIKMCFHYKLFVLKIQGQTCSLILLHVAFIDFGLMGWTSKYLHMNMPQLKIQQHNPNFNLQLCDKQQIAT